MNVQTQRTENGPVVDCQVTPAFDTSELMVQAMVDRITWKTRYLANAGKFVKGVTLTDAKMLAAEIDGMISLLHAVCDADDDLQVRLVFNLRMARNEAFDRLRK